MLLKNSTFKIISGTVSLDLKLAVSPTFCLKKKWRLFTCRGGEGVCVPITIGFFCMFSYKLDFYSINLW